jgi:nitroreductase
MTPDAALQALLSRQSLGGKHLGEPGPDDAALALMAEAALRAPDHAELAPFRFAVVRGAARERLADLFAAAAAGAGKSIEAQAIERERALATPVTVALLARIDRGHPLVPEHEQWCAVGGALANFLHAAHLLGYAGKMLSGHKVRHAAIQAAFCEAGETLVGWVVLGTARRAAGRRMPKAAAGALLRTWQG